MATLVDSDFVRIFYFQIVHFQHINQELTQLIGVLPYLPDGFRLLNDVKVLPDMIGTTTGRGHHIIKFTEIPDEVMVHRNGLLLGSTVCKRLPATGLFQRITNLLSQFLKQFEGCHAHMGIKLIDVTRG